MDCFLICGYTYRAEKFFCTIVGTFGTLLLFCCCSNYSEFIEETPADEIADITSSELRETKSGDCSA